MFQKDGDTLNIEGVLGYKYVATLQLDEDRNNIDSIDVFNIECDGDYPASFLSDQEAFDELMACEWSYVIICIDLYNKYGEYVWEEDIRWNTNNTSEKDLIDLVHSLIKNDKFYAGRML